MLGQNYVSEWTSFWRDCSALRVLKFALRINAASSMAKGRPLLLIKHRNTAFMSVIRHEKR